MGSKGSITELSVQLGKVPPQATDFEEAVLGAIMLEMDAINYVIDVLKPESFYHEKNQVIYTAILDLYKSNEPIDLLTVTSQLRKNGTLEIAGGAYNIAELTTHVNSGANIEYHARIIKEMSMKRQLIGLSHQIMEGGYEDTIDVFDLIGDTSVSLEHIQDDNIRGRVKKLSDTVDETILELYESRHKLIPGMTSGFRSLDRLTGGWQPSELVIIAARPGMGKTGFVVNCALNSGEPTAIFSLEMSTNQLNKRIISSESEIPLQKLILTNTMTDPDWDRISDSTEKIKGHNLFIDDTESLSIIELRSKARKLAAQHGVKLIIIDYIQLMRGYGIKGQNREGEISDISRALKGLSKELQIPVIALSQLNRAVESRGGDKKPQLSDLRESGSIEQDADMVLFLYRPEYYQMYEDGAGNNLRGKGQIIIAKHRQGKLDSVFLKFRGEFVRWENEETVEIVDHTEPQPKLEF